MNLDSIRLELTGPQTGLSMFDENGYLATYRSLNDCILDLAYRFCVDKLENVVKAFTDKSALEITAPMEYRGVCSEMFWPTDTIFRYVYYKNTLTELFDCFSFHEERAMRHSEHFLYGVQGTGIHRFNPDKGWYDFWVGGDLKTVADVMNELKMRG